MEQESFHKEKAVPYGLNIFAYNAYKGAILRGEVEGRGLLDFLDLCRRELENAQRHMENGFPPGYIYSGPGVEPSGIPFNLANCILFILVYCVQEGVDSEKMLTDKNHYNQIHYAFLWNEKEKANAKP